MCHQVCITGYMCPSLCVTMFMVNDTFFSPQHFLGLKRLYSDYPNCLTRWNVISYNTNDSIISSVAVLQFTVIVGEAPVFLQSVVWRTHLKVSSPDKNKQNNNREIVFFQNPRPKAMIRHSFSFQPKTLQSYTVRARRQQITITIYFILPNGKLKLLFDLIH